MAIPSSFITAVNELARDLSQLCDELRSRTPASPPNINTPSQEWQERLYAVSESLGDHLVAASLLGSHLTPANNPESGSDRRTSSSGQQHEVSVRPRSGSAEVVTVSEDVAVSNNAAVDNTAHLSVISSSTRVDDRLGDDSTQESLSHQSAGSKGQEEIPHQQDTNQQQRTTTVNSEPQQPRPSEAVDTGNRRSITPDPSNQDSTEETPSRQRTVDPSSLVPLPENEAEPVHDRRSEQRPMSEGRAALSINNRNSVPESSPNDQQEETTPCTTETSSTEERRKNLRSRAGTQPTHVEAASSSTEARLSSDETEEIPYVQYIVESEDIPSINQDQLDKNMVATVLNLSQAPGANQKARLPWVPEEMADVDIKKELTPDKDPDLQYNEVQPLPDGSVSVCREDLAEEHEFEWPEFQNQDGMSTRQTIQVLVRWLINPEFRVSYYCGIMKSRLWKVFPLDAGKLASVPGLTRVNEIYTHLGKIGSATAMHHEDDKFASVNLGLLGTKLFILVDPQDTKKFEDWVRDNYDTEIDEPDCPQFVRHLDRFFSPDQLEAAGINFTIQIQRVGDLIWTKPFQYHQVLNVEDSLSISINFIDPTETPHFQDKNDPLKVCHKCGLQGLLIQKRMWVVLLDSNMTAFESRSAMRGTRGHKRKAIGEPLNTKRTTRARGEPSVDSDHAVSSVKKDQTKSSLSAGEIKKVIQASVSDFEIPQQTDEETLQLYKMIAWVLSEEAIKQFTSLIRAWRDRDTQPVISSTGDSISQYVGYLRTAVTKNNLSKFQVRYAQSCLAREVDKELASYGRQRARGAFLTNISRRVGMTTKELTTHIDEGRQWNKVCGTFDGLLPFIFVHAKVALGVQVKAWRDLTKKPLGLLLGLLKQLGKPLEQRCAAGRIAQDIILGDSDRVFAWEDVPRSLGVEDVPFLAKVL